MIVLAWVLATAFLIYLSLRSSSIIVKVLFAVLVFAFQIILGLFAILVSGFDDLILFALVDLWIFELAVCSVYKFRNISYKALLLGFATLIFLGIWKYFHGSVIGEINSIDFIICDVLIHRKAAYLIYCWNSYFIDVACPWFLVINVFISPFWSRRPCTENWWLKLVSYCTNTR